MPPKQRFIPGLNSRPDDEEMPPPPPDKTDLDLLHDEFMKGKKNAAMCLHEYCQKVKQDLNFQDGPVEFKPGQPRTFSNFGCNAVIDGVKYPQGVGTNKKQAKVDASRLCIRALTGLDDFVPEEVKPELEDNRFVEVRDLLDICAAENIHYEKMMTQDAKGVYSCSIFLSNRDPIKHTHTDRDEAVIVAHREAIRILRGYEDTSNPLDLGTNGVAEAAAPCPGKVRVPDAAIAQRREQAAYIALDRSLQTLPPEMALYDHNIAAIFLSNQLIQEFKDIGRIVAFGTGNSSLAVESITPDGRCVIDSTAVTQARRALKRYLGHEMLLCYNNNPASIFERNPSTPTRLRLKPGFEFHLFISHPPEGDYLDFLPTPTNFTQEQQVDISKGAHMPTFTDDSHGLLKCRNEQGMVELSNQTPEQPSLQRVKLTNEVWVMSASDKLLRWNILGLQGAAYTHFMEPLYLKSISLGYHPQNDHGHLCRAVCCRVYPELEAEFPPSSGYHINHPELSFCPTPDVRTRAQPGTYLSPHSINWNANDSRAELTDGATGRSNPNSPFQVSQNPLSRQCKAGLHLKWFKDLRRHGSPELMGKGPMDVKALATDYQLVKAAFLKHCDENGIGKWLHMPKDMWVQGL